MKHYCVLVFLFVAVFDSIAVADTFPVSNQTQFQNALDAADSNGENDIINISSGRIDLASGLYYSAQEGENYTLTIQGAGAGLTIIDGDTKNAILGVSTLGAISDNNAHVTIAGITFQNGYST